MAKIDSYRGLGCLVTGASAGIGREIARQLAGAGARVAISARRVDRLEALATELSERGAEAVHVCPADLAAAGGPADLFAAARGHLGEVDVLVNNAGFGMAGPFVRADPERLRAMLQVNVVAAVELARLALPGMVRRDRGGLLTVASMAGLECAPYQSAYGGTKAFLVNWSHGVHQETKHTGVAVTALCPGVTDTEFFEVAGYQDLGGFLARRMPAARVARVGLAALRRDRMQAVPGFGNRMLLFASRFVPRALSAEVSRRLMAGRPARRK